jgi:hypothetical protein
MSANGVVAEVLPTELLKLDQKSAAIGLTSDEARTRLDKDGTNAMPNASTHPLLNAVMKLWRRPILGDRLPSTSSLVII